MLELTEATSLLCHNESVGQLDSTLLAKYVPPGMTYLALVQHGKLLDPLLRRNDIRLVRKDLLH